MSEVFQGVPVGGNTKTPTVKSISPSKQWCFTYNNYLSEDICSIVSIFNENHCKYVFQEETGESGTPHLQGSVMFENKVRPMSIFKMFKGIHWEKTKDLKASIAYCCKEESRTGNVFSNIPLPKKLKLIENLYEWQNSIIKGIKEIPDDRKIYWFCDYDGGCGKSSFVKYLCYHHNGIVLCGKSSDMKNGILQYKEANGYFPELILIDLPRTFNNDYLSYTGIEEIKNGCFYSPKYEGGMALFNNPHIIIFSNKLPDVNNLSLDRWKIKVYDPIDKNFYKM
jgi:hypothetical protein